MWHDSHTVPPCFAECSANKLCWTSEMLQNMELVLDPHRWFFTCWKHDSFLFSTTQNCLVTSLSQTSPSSFTPGRCSSDRLASKQLISIQLALSPLCLHKAWSNIQSRTFDLSPSGLSADWFLGFNCRGSKKANQNLFREPNHSRLQPHQPSRKC